jgi:hypothetical protein
LAVFESKKKMVACTNINSSSSSGRINNSYTGFCSGSLYLCNILIIKNYRSFILYPAFIMAESEKIKIKKTKRRIPLPAKPPKVEAVKKSYNRKKEKKKFHRIIKGDEEK